MDQTHHVIDYVEINVHDLTAARTFYESAFGWAFNDYGPTYAGIRTAEGSGEVGGLTTNGTPGPGGALLLIVSEDLDASVAAV